MKLRRGGGALNIVHFLAIVALIQELLKGDAGCGVIQHRLQAFPGISQFRRALDVVERGRIKYLPVHTFEDISERDFRGSFGEQVAPILAPLAFYDLLRFQLDQDLNQIINRDALFRGQIVSANR
ncbi:MAG: hypothetical protein JWM99_1134 [Verrucomicrobiales bacterium]|nr:hypothetical protein [Verrucomicrobiales bacterium]